MKRWARFLLALALVFFFSVGLPGCGDSDSRKELKEGFEKKARDLKDQVEKKASEAKEGAEGFLKKQVDQKTKGYNRGPEDREQKE